MMRFKYLSSQRVRLDRRVMKYIPLLCDTQKCVLRLLNALSEVYRLKLYEYNRKISTFKVYLKPLHIVIKQHGNRTKTYYYYGKYWYKVFRKDGKLKWVYLGCTKPYDSLPDPPLNPLTLIEMKHNNNFVCIHIVNNERALRAIVEALTLLKRLRYMV